MKRLIITTVLIVASCITTKACDICGCGTGSGYIGILPDFNKRIMGIRYRTNSLKTHVGIGGSNSYLTTQEYYRVAEFWSAVNLSGKIRGMVTIPYNFNERENSAGVNRKNGLGDLSFTGFYNVLNSRSPVGERRLLVQSLWLGAGVKLPTGKYRASNKENSNDANIFQLGTGSVDFNLTAMYDIRLQDFGININSSYKINSRNSDDYRYGNKFSTIVQAYHKFKVGKNASMAPNAGISIEQSNKDRDGQFLMDVSGGSLTAGSVGIEFSYKKIVAGFNLQEPLRQNLADGLVKANNKAMFHLAIAL
jgi:hypothetical protein